MGMDAPSLKKAGILIFLGTLQFLFFLELAQIFYPGYSVSSNVISDLGATCKGGVCRFVQPSSDIFDTSVILLGLALVLAGHYLNKTSGLRALAVFEALAGAGAIGVGVFNESYGAPHVLFSAITFFFGGLQALLAYKVAKPPYSYFSAVAGIVTLVAFVLYGADTYLGLGQGGMERMIAYPVLLGGLAFGGYLMALGDRGDAYLP
jgi:hypothetical membrane protein